MPIGAEVQSAGGVHFRVWAPRRKTLAVVLSEKSHTLSIARNASGTETTLEPQEGGYFSGLVAEAGAGSRYGFRMDEEDRLYPDPVSRLQPDGPHGLSQVVDPAAFEWHDAAWPGPDRLGQVTYEMHVGTFTREGTFQAAAHELAYLANLGITLIEVMPVAEFAGRFGWGYDGVCLFAPTRLYGRPMIFGGSSTRPIG